MIKKRKTPYMLYIMSALLCLLCAYYLGGLYKSTGITLENVTTKMTYIMLHPFQNWWSKKTPVFLGVSVVAWFLFVGNYSYRERNFHFDKEHGQEEWADVQKLSKVLREKEEKKNRILSKNIQISKRKLSNNNMLVIGAPGTFKTNSLLTPNLLLAACTYIVLDVKGEVQYKYANYLKQKGYHISSLNLKEPWLSDRYNPFVNIKRESDLIRLITNIQESVKKPDAMQGDPFWDDGVGLYLQSMFFYEWLQAKDEGRIGNMNNILYLVNLESTKVDDKTTMLQKLMDGLAKKRGNSYPPVRDYRKLKEGATETVRSIIIMVNAMLKLCETADVKRIFSGNEIDIPSLGLGIDGNQEKKTALFLVLPDNDSSYNFLISMFYTQMFDVLMRIADDDIHGPLPIEVEVWMDEFYAGAKPTNPDVLLGTVRSRNISMIPILQSVSQIKTLFKGDKWETITDTCAVMTFLGAGASALSTHKWISELLGNATIDTRTDGLHTGANGNGNVNYAKSKRTLMEPAEIRRMPREDCIILMEGQNPIYDQKALPFNMKRFKEAMALGGYVHPVRTVYNEEKMEYRTIITKEPLLELSKDELCFYKEASKTDQSIKIFDVDEKDLLYLNWNRKPLLSEEQIIALYQGAKKKELNYEVPEDVIVMQEKEYTKQVEVHPAESKRDWDLSGDIVSCIKRYGELLGKEELNEILSGLECGLTDKQIKSYFCLSAEAMKQYKRAYATGI